MVVTPSEDADGAVGILRFQDLDHDVGRRTKAEEADGLAVRDVRQMHGSIADHTGAEQGGCFGVTERGRDGVGESFVDECVLGIAARGGEPGPARLRAEVLP